MGILPTNNISSGGLARESSHCVLLHLITSGLGILLNWPYNTERWGEKDTNKSQRRSLTIVDTSQDASMNGCDMFTALKILKHVSIYRWHSMTDLIGYYSGNIAFSSQEIVFNLFETLPFQF